MFMVEFTLFYGSRAPYTKGMYEHNFNNMLLYIISNSQSDRPSPFQRSLKVIPNTAKKGIKEYRR